MPEPAQTAFDQLLANLRQDDVTASPDADVALARTEPKVDAPKVDAPKVDAPKVDAPKVDAPKVDTRSAERALTGNEYADLIAAYLAQNYGPRGLVIYREVHLGKSIIGKNRRVDILGIHAESRRAIAVECKYQATAGTVDEKIPYTLDDLAALHIPAFAVYAGEGFSQGVLHLLRASRLAAHCLPSWDLSPGGDTIELDHLIATTFGWWELVLKSKQPFDVERWLQRTRESG